MAIGSVRHALEGKQVHDRAAHIVFESMCAQCTTPTRTATSTHTLAHTHTDIQPTRKRWQTSATARQADRHTNRQASKQAGCLLYTSDAADDM
eukprot:8175766-Alexandrium_andersonii.AAC.1